MAPLDSATLSTADVTEADVTEASTPTATEASTPTAGHGLGQCRPCKFRMKGLCRSGSECRFCHLCDAGVPVRGRRERRHRRQGLEPGDGLSLAQVVAELREVQEDPSCILTLCKVELLGDSPKEALDRYFGHTPGFKRVIIVYSQAKNQDPNGDRRHPSGLAFVLFASPRFVRLVLANGSEQLVDGVTVSIGRYEPAGAAAQPPLQANPSMELHPQSVEEIRVAL